MFTPQFNPYYFKLISYAQHNRKQKIMTKTEGLVRNYLLKERKMLGYKFLRQRSIDFFILDFYCAKLKLWIEIDGEYHNEASQAAYDEERTKILETLHIKIIRIKNKDILSNLEGIQQYIEYEVNMRKQELSW